MSHLVLQPTITAQWHALVKDAESSYHLILDEDLESYLVFLLTRFTSKPEMAKSVLALEFLEGVQTNGRKKHDHLRDVGDKCLLIAGLFPGRANRRRVKISYFVQLGQSAYTSLAAISQQKISELYTAVGQSFVPLMDVLHVVREMSQQLLTPIEAEELWSDVHSRHALTVLERYTNAKPTFDLSRLSKKH